jgi:hypothetical protein
MVLEHDAILSYRIMLWTRPAGPYMLPINDHDPTIMASGCGEWADGD